LKYLKDKQYFILAITLFLFFLSLIGACKNQTLVQSNDKNNQRTGFQVSPRLSVNKSMSAIERYKSIPQSYQNLEESELRKIPEVQIIEASPNGSWQSNNINGVHKHIFLIKPGDYRSWGTLHLNRTGTKDQEKIISYYNPKNAKSLDFDHPVNMKDDERVIIQNFRISRSDYWNICGINFRKAETIVGIFDFNVITTEANHNVVDRCIIEDVSTGNALYIHASHNNTIQNCVIKNTLQKKDADRIGITISGENSEANYNQILNNEIYNCTQGVQVEYRDSYQNGQCAGTLIANNDIYITEDLHRYYGTDTLACAEIGIVLKIGGSDISEKNISKVINNRVWGFRKTDLSCSGSGGSQGCGIQLMGKTNNVLVQDNIVFDLPMGIKIATSDPKIKISKTANIAILNNLVFDIKKRASVDNPTGLFVSGSADILYNTVINANEGIQFDDASKAGLKRLVHCNNFLNIDKYYYIGSPENNDLQLNAMSQSQISKKTSRKQPKKLAHTLYLNDIKNQALEDVRFTIKQWTDPTEVLVKNVIPTKGFTFSSSNYKAQCDCSPQGNGNRWWSPLYFDKK
jgi:hypothetical protein